MSVQSKRQKKNVGLSVITKNGGLRSHEMAMSGVQIVQVFQEQVTFFLSFFILKWHGMVTRMKNSKDWIRGINHISRRHCGMLSFVESYCRSWHVWTGLLSHEFATDQICAFLLYIKHSISNCEGMPS